MCSVAHSCLILWDLMDCGPPGPAVHRIFQARIAGSHHGRSLPWKGHAERPDGQGESGLKGPLPEHLPRNQNLSVYCLLYYTFLTLQGAITDHLSLEKVNLELQLVSCIWKEYFSSNPSDGSLTCLTGSSGLLQLVIVYSPPTVRGTKLKTS